MIKFCRDCAYAESRSKGQGMEVKCTSELTPISWRNSWIYRSLDACINKPLMCPCPEQGFKQKEKK